MKIGAISGGIDADVLGDASPELQAIIDAAGTRSHRFFQGESLLPRASPGRRCLGR